MYIYVLYHKNTYIQKILLHYCMEDDCDKEIEEDGGTVFPSILVK